MPKFDRKTPMEKVINGKLYDSDTAEHIAENDNKLYDNDFSYCKESLYITKNGDFFVAGQGGQLSRWPGCGGIEVLTKAQALDWCEKHDVDAYTITHHFEIVEG